ncbi:type I 3-dehydroquinate dehydratase [Candidatus Daviesbacteria bacterium]|nr:type I 3-dehydroquinate dehydratase [Candidatus Daviesbacteria bacterium]
MQIKYCLPIIKNTKKEVLKSLKTEGYDFYEIWLDYIKDLDDKFLTGIAKAYKGNLIFLFRRQNLEKIKLSLEKRQQIISLLSNFSIVVDLDFLTQYEELQHLKQYPKIKLILSYHNYKETPKPDYLWSLVSKMKKYNSYILKIATFCQKETDGLSLLNFQIKLKNEKLRYIVLGMGKKGLITRIFGSIWGNQFSFAPIDIKDRSAEGQLTKKQMENILQEVG